MDPEIVQELVFMIVQFLRDQLNLSNSPSSCLKEEGAESVEVAMQCLETAYGLNERSHGTHRSLYAIYSNYRQSEDTFVQNSANVFGSAISEADKEEAEKLKNEGNQLMREEKFTEALNYYTRAIGKDNQNAVFFCNRAAAHSKLNNHEDAIQDCKKALSIDPQYSKAYSRMGLAYLALRHPSKAKESFENALQLEPDNESCKQNLKIAEEELETQRNQPPSAGLGGSGMFNLGSLLNSSSAGPPDLQGLLSNPALMNMATQLMSNPSVQNMMSSVFGGGQGAAPSAPSAPPAPTEAPNASSSEQPQGQGIDALLRAGRQLAEQMQAQNPELVEQLRSQMNRNPDDNSKDSNNSSQPDQS